MNAAEATKKNSVFEIEEREREKKPFTHRHFIILVPIFSPLVCFARVEPCGTNKRKTSKSISRGKKSATTSNWISHMGGCASCTIEWTETKKKTRQKLWTKADLIKHMINVGLLKNKTCRIVSKSMFGSERVRQKRRRKKNKSNDIGINVSSTNNLRCDDTHHTHVYKNICLEYLK